MNTSNNTPAIRLARLFSLLLMVITFLVMFVYCVFLPRTKESDMDQLAEKPELTLSSLLDGSYTANMTDYFSDTVYGRDRIKDLYNRFKGWFGKETVLTTTDGEEEQLFGSGSGFGDDPPDDSSDPPYDPPVSGSEGPSDPSVGTGSSGGESGSTGSEPGSSGNETSSTEPDPPPALNEELCDAGTILGTRALEVYYGDRNLNHIPDFAATLNNFAASLPGVNVYSMPIPKACAYYLQTSSTYANQTGNSLRDMKAIAERLSGVKNIDIYDVLKDHANEEIYFRTDHHWTGLGAYYAAQKFANDLQLPFQDLSAYEKNVRPGYVGTMYKYSGYKQVLKDNPEDFVTYKPKVGYTATFYNQSFGNGRTRSAEDGMFFHYGDDKVSSWYSTYLNGDAYAWQIKSDVCSNGRRLLIVKDSYGNPLANYLLYSFEEIYVVDARVFELKLKGFITDHGITDVLFAESLFSAVGGSYINQLKVLCS